MFGLGCVWVRVWVVGLGLGLGWVWVGFGLGLGWGKHLGPDKKVEKNLGGRVGGWPGDYK